MFYKNIFFYVFLLLLIIGYILISPLPYFLNLESHSITIPFRILVLISAILIIFNQLMIKKGKLPKVPIWYYLFWSIYLGKMAFDLYYTGIIANMFEYKIQYFEYAIFISLLPSLSIFFIPNNTIDFSKLLKCVYFILFFILLISILHLPMRGGTTSGILSMYYISYGHLGATLAFLSFFMFLEYRSTQRWSLQIIYILGFFWGLFIIYLAAARSPVISLIIMLAVYVVNKKGILKALNWLIVIISLSALVLFLFSYFLSHQFHSTFLIRIGEMLQGSTNGRADRWLNALTEFLHHPILGGAFLLQKEPGIGVYPHNMVLEVMMATGIIGLLCFGGWLLTAFRASIRILKDGKNTWIVYLLIQYFVLGLTSYSVFTNNYFWYFSCIIIWMAQENKWDLCVTNGN